MRFDVGGPRHVGRHGVQHGHETPGMLGAAFANMRKAMYYNIMRRACSCLHRKRDEVCNRRTLRRQQYNVAGPVIGRCVVDACGLSSCSSNCHIA